MTMGLTMYFLPAPPGPPSDVSATVSPRQLQSPLIGRSLPSPGREVVEITCGPGTRFQPDCRDAGRVHPAARRSHLASPANPTGTAIPPEDPAAIATRRETIRSSAGQRRALRRPRLTWCARDEPRVEELPRRHRRRTSAEVLRDDGLAPRWLLPPRSCTARLTGSRRLSIRPPTPPTRRRRRVHAESSPRPTPCRRLRRQPGAPAARAAGDRVPRLAPPTARSTSTPTSPTIRRDPGILRAPLADTGVAIDPASNSTP